MRLGFLKKLSSNELSESFDATKKISDYVGMLTRLVFLSVISAFVADNIDASRLTSWKTTELLKVIFLISLLLINVFFGIAFVSISRSIIIATLWIDRPASKGRLQNIAFNVIQPLLMIITAVTIFSFVFSVPLVVRDFANSQEKPDIKERNMEFNK